MGDYLILRRVKLHRKVHNRLVTRVPGVVVMYMMNLWCKCHQWLFWKISWTHLSILRYRTSFFLWASWITIRSTPLSFQSPTYWRAGKSLMASMEAFHDVTQNFFSTQCSIWGCQVLSRWPGSAGLGLRRSPNILFLLTRLYDWPESVKQQGYGVAWNFFS